MVDRAHRPTSITSTGKSTNPQPTVQLSPSNDRVTATLSTGESVSVLLHGATVVSWKNAQGRENLWLSEKAVLDGSKAVRGGVPICFPNFGPPPSNHATSSLPQHGFARNTRWEFLGKETSETDAPPAEDNSVKLDFGLYSPTLDDKTKDAWPFAFGLVYSVTLSPGALRTTVSVRNEGEETWEFQLLLHTYLAVEDVTKVAITGLSSVTYIDKVLDASTHTQSTPEVRIAGEVDRVYSAIPQSTMSVVEAGKPRFDVVRDNMADTVVWNPWKEKAAGMGDFAPKDGYLRMVCVEAGAVSQWVKLEAGEAWEGGQVLKSLL